MCVYKENGIFNKLYNFYTEVRYCTKNPVLNRRQDAAIQYQEICNYVSDGKKI